MRISKKCATVIGSLAVGSLALSACGSSSSGSKPGGSTPSSSGGASATPSAAGTLTAGTSGKNDSPHMTVKAGGEIVTTIEKDIADFNINTSAGNVFDAAQVMNPIFPSVYNVDQDLNVFLNTDLMDSVTPPSTDPTAPEVVVYKIKPTAMWSDGKPIDATDFTYIWTSTNGTNKNYTPASTTGYEDIASVVGSDNDKTVTVTFKNKFADWKSLFSNLLPAHYMTTLNADPVKAYNEGLLAPNYPKVSGGPFMIQSFKSNDNVTEVRNDMYYGAKAPLDKVTFKIITDSTQEPTALANGEVNYIYPQPQVDLISAVAQQGDAITSDIGFGLIFEHFDLNLANKFLADAPLRQALFTAVNTQDIVNKTVKQFSDKSAPLGNRMLVQQQPGYQDNSGTYGKGDLAGAKKILTDAGYTGVGTALTTKAGTKVAALRFEYTTGNTLREQEGELFKAAAAQLGVPVKIQPTTDLGGTLTKHDFDVIVFAWVGTPFPFSANKALYVTGGESNYDSYSSPAVDTALKDAASQLDTTKATADLNTADKQLFTDAVTLPLYQKATYLAYDKKYGNIVNNSTQVGPTFNIGSWGLL